MDPLDGLECSNELACLSLVQRDDSNIGRREAKVKEVLEEPHHKRHLFVVEVAAVEIPHFLNTL